MNEMTKIETTLKDWETDQEVRWCPGCGDYAILKAVQRTMRWYRALAEGTPAHALCEADLQAFLEDLG